MWAIPTVPGVPSVPATCEAGPAEEERLKKLKAKEESCDAPPDAEAVPNTSPDARNKSG